LFEKILLLSNFLLLIAIIFEARIKSKLGLFIVIVCFLIAMLDLGFVAFKFLW